MLTMLQKKNEVFHALSLITKQWIRYPILNKRDLSNRLYAAKIFSKFDMKSGFWQIQIAEQDRYKMAFTVPFGHYE